MSNCDNCPSKGRCGKDASKCGVEELNAFSRIKSTVAVMSGKGGVGKSSIAVLAARELKGRGLRVGILDADITGPSIPRLVGIPPGSRCERDAMGIHPILTSDGIPVISLGFFLEEEEEPVIWRGPVLSSAVRQFWTDVFWGELDCLLIDMPPGTGDVVLTVMQSIPLRGVIVVSTPHDLVSMVVAKSVNMARKLNVSVLGLVENMAYITCPDCGREIRLFDPAELREYLKKDSIELLGSLPMLPQVAAMSQGGITALDGQAAATIKTVGDKIANTIE
jgi:Mrp family chromosome partitioning ATPase